MTIFRNDLAPRYQQLFSMLCVVKVLEKLDVISFVEMGGAAISIFDMKKQLDEDQANSFKGIQSESTPAESTSKEDY